VKAALAQSAGAPSHSSEVRPHKHISISRAAPRTTRSQFRSADRRKRLISESGRKGKTPTSNDASSVPMKKMPAKPFMPAAIVWPAAPNSLVDYNRGRCGLAEMFPTRSAARPERPHTPLRNPPDHRYLGVSDANMQEGSLRCDVEHLGCGADPTIPSREGGDPRTYSSRRSRAVDHESSSDQCDRGPASRSSRKKNALDLRASSTARSMRSKEGSSDTATSRAGSGT